MPVKCERYYILIITRGDQVKTLPTQFECAHNCFGITKMNLTRLYTKCGQKYNFSKIISYRTPCWWGYPPKSATARELITVRWVRPVQSTLALWHWFANLFNDVTYKVRRQRQTTQTMHWVNRANCRLAEVVVAHGVQVHTQHLDHSVELDIIAHCIYQHFSVGRLVLFIILLSWTSVSINRTIFSVLIFQLKL